MQPVQRNEIPKDAPGEDQKSHAGSWKSIDLGSNTHHSREGHLYI
jgi:hypothetical protein